MDFTSDNMTTTQSIQILTEYQAWRRGAETPMQDPLTIREAIDKAIEVMIGSNIEAQEGDCCPPCGSDKIVTTIYCNTCHHAH